MIVAEIAVATPFTKSVAVTVFEDAGAASTPTRSLVSATFDCTTNPELLDEDCPQGDR